MDQQALASAVRAWKAVRLRHLGASAMKIACSRRQTASSSMPFTRSNRGPNSNVPTMPARPIQIHRVDICSVVLEVQTSMSGNDIVIILTLALYNYNQSMSYLQFTLLSYINLLQFGFTPILSFTQTIKLTLAISQCLWHKRRVHIQGGQAKVRPTYISDGNIWMYS